MIKFIRNIGLIICIWREVRWLVNYKYNKTYKVKLRRDKILIIGYAHCLTWLIPVTAELFLTNYDNDYLTKTEVLQKLPNLMKRLENAIHQKHQHPYIPLTHVLS